MQKNSIKKKMIYAGTAAGDSINKTVVVELETLKTHPKYHKKIRVTKRYKVHDPENSVKAGEYVRFEMSRPISKDKKFIKTR